MQAPSLRRRTRLAAWVVTGPVGHLYGGLADLAGLAVRLVWARVRGRELHELLEQGTAGGATADRSRGRASRSSARCRR